MIVQDLIDELSKLDPESDIVIVAHDGVVLDVVNVKSGRYKDIDDYIHDNIIETEVISDAVDEIDDYDFLDSTDE